MLRRSDIVNICAPYVFALTTSSNCDIFRPEGDVENEGEMYIFYTGVNYTDEDPENINVYRNSGFSASQMMETGYIFETPELKGGYHIDVFADRNLIEVYINDGEYVLSSVVYGTGSEIKGKDYSIYTYGGQI